MLITEPRPGFSFHVVGSDDEDSLIVSAERLATGRLTIGLPVASLPWRDLRLIEQHGRARQPYGCEVDDPLAKAQVILDSDQEVEERTGVVGAQTLTLEGGWRPWPPMSAARSWSPACGSRRERPCPSWCGWRRRLRARLPWSTSPSYREADGSAAWP